MAYRFDPKNFESTALLDYVGDFTGRNILEVGCGNGRLTWLYADQAAHVTAIDPDGEKIAQAIADRSAELQDKVSFWQATIDEFETTQTYDLIIFSWSL